MTFQEAKDAGFIQALLDGKMLQAKDPTQPSGWIEPITTFYALDNHPVSRIRIKPTPRRVPLTADDLPPVFWVQTDTDKNAWHLCTMICKTGISYGNTIFIWSALPECGLVWSTDRKVERPFWKEVEG